MSNSFRSVNDYELFLYSLQEKFSSIRNFTVVLVKRGTALARVSGEIQFDHEFRLVVRERLVFDSLVPRIDAYGYEVFRGTEKLYWYDSQPHPNEPSLQGTYPHHKHIPPDIKHHRIPASQPPK